MRSRRFLLPLLLLAASAFAQEEEPEPTPFQAEQARNEELRKDVEQLAQRGEALAQRLRDRQHERENARAERTRLEEAYESGGADIPTEDEVLAKLQTLADQTNRSSFLALMDELDAERAGFEEIRDASARWLVDLAGEIEAARKRGEGGWAALEDERRELLKKRRRLAAQHANTVREIKGVYTSIDEARRRTLFFLRRKNLFLRGRSAITPDALTRGFTDLGNLPAWMAGAVGGTASYVGEPDHHGALLRLAGLLAAAFLFLFFAGRWVKRRSDADGLKAHALGIAARVLRALAFAVVFFLAPFLAARLLPGLNAGVQAWLRVLAYVLGGYWVARVVYAELFKARPPAEEPLVKLEEGAQSLLALGVNLLLYLSAVAVPLLYGLELLGYGNKGMIEFGWLVYKTLLAGIVLIMLLRGTLLTSFLPGEDSAAGRLLAFLVRYLRPLALILVPAILVFDALRYDIIAGLLTRYTVAAFTVLIAGSLIYRLFVFLADFGVSALYPPDKPGLYEKRVAARGGLLFIVRIVFFFVALSIFLRLAGSDIDEMHALLDAPLPLGEKTWWNLVVGVFYLLLFLFGTGHAKAVLQQLVLARTKLDRGVQYTITTLAGYLLVFAGFYLGIKQLFDLSNIGYIFAALSVGIGFGLQEIVSNFVSGLILLFERPLKVGDLIEVGQNEGIVTQINIRATTVLTRDNVYLLVPNREFIGQTVVNYRHKDPKIRIHVAVGVSYGSDTRLVEKTLVEVADKHEEVLKRPAPEIWFTAFGDSSLDFEMLVWINDPPARNRISSELCFAIFDAFAEKGIEIPFPQRDLHIRSDFREKRPARKKKPEAEPEPEADGSGD